MDEDRIYGEMRDAFRNAVNMAIYQVSNKYKDKMIDAPETCVSIVDDVFHETSHWEYDEPII